MFYRLKENYILRGWSDLPWTLVKRPENIVQTLTQKEFQVLMLCDGETELPTDLMDAAMEKTLQNYEETDIVECCESPVFLETDQYYKYYHNRFVRKVFWSITGRCNYRCRHCYMDAPEGALGELSTTQAFDLIDQMAECGVLQVDISGGEPFVRKDFWQLIDRILSYHMVVRAVYTNGWLFNEKTVQEFEKRDIKPEICISFDGVGWHDWMRGVPGAEEVALRAFELCHKHGFATYASMCIHRGNVSSIPKTVNILRSVGCESIGIGGVAYTESWARNNEDKKQSEEEYIQSLIPYITWYYQMGQPVEHLHLRDVAVLERNKSYRITASRYDGTEKCLNRYMCSSARMNCYITPEGRLLPCMPMTASPQQDKFPLVQDIGLRQGLSDSYYMQFVNGRIKDLLAANSECNACEYRYKCGGGCRAIALLEGDHDLMGCDRTMCMMWKEGYVDRIRQIADEAVAKYGGPMEK